jgi:Lipocalin-like domain
MKKLLLPVIGFFLLVSCNKKNETPAKTKTDLLCQANWKFSAATVGGSDVSSQIQPCYKDNIIKFNANGTGTVDEGASICTAGNPQTYNITWSFLSGETQLKVNPPLLPGGSDTYTVVSISETQLVASQLMTLPAPFGAQTVVVTFVH